MLANYDAFKAGALVIADQKRRAAEEEYQRAVARDSRPYAMAEAEDKFRKALADALSQYQVTVEAAIRA
jgi:hypothetical protein